MNTNSKTCEACVHFQSVASGKTGFCHRFPPSNANTESGDGAEFPLVVSKTWCGEFAAKETNENL